MELFEKLGDEIEVEWRNKDYDESLLPEIAKRTLIDHAIPSKMTPWDVLEWTLGQAELPRQEDVAASFGEPPITVYSGNRFYIDVYFWFTGTTATHQHAFSGAFQVFAGSSIHSWYAFEPDDIVNSFMQFGKMELKLCELLSVGDVQEILAGRQYIHSLFHLDEPSVTIVVRTRKSPLFLPQFSYHKPSLAADPFFAQDTLTKKIQCLAALVRSKIPEADDMISAVLDQSDIHSSYHLLSNLRNMTRSNKVEKLFNVKSGSERFEKLFDVSKRRHGRRAERLADVFSTQEAKNAIVERRGYVSEPQLRYFLAVLLNVEGRENIYALIKQRFPESNPQEKVLDWVFDLANTRVMGIEPPNALGVEAFNDVDSLVLESMLNGESGEQTLASIAASGANTDSLDERLAKIRNSTLLQGLVTEVDN